ncbi:MAG: hypothetical protein PUC12_00930 [Clostridiales bacterium]|nr:hypothetical protein [Clostridiales bacterium]
MNYVSKAKRILAWVLVFAVSLTTVFTNGITAEAASKKVVKTLSGVPSKKTLTEGKSTTIKAKVTATKSVAKGDLQVSVKSSNKAIATVRVSKKPTKKAKTGTNQIVVTGKKAGTATITVTTRATNKKNKKISKKTKVTVVKPTVPTTTEATTTQATTTEATTEATTATTTEVPKVEPKKVTKISSINDKTGEIVLTFDGNVTESELKSTTLTVTAEDGTEIKAAFKEVSEEGNTATYTVDLSKVETGEYKVASDNTDIIVITKEIGSTSAKIQITGSSVKGLVYYRENGIIAVSNAKVTVGGKTVKTNEDGFYEIKANAQQNGQVSVKADGFFDAIKENIDIVDNKASAYNFEMEPYDISQIYIYGTVTNAGENEKVVSGATVTLYEGQEVKAQTKTDRNGCYAFKNEYADISNFSVDSNSIVEFPLGEYIVKDKDYTIKVEKDLTPSNLTDVYESKTTEKIELGSVKNVNVNVSLAKVKAMGEITLNLNWEENAVNKAKSKKVSVTFMNTDGSTVLKEGIIDLTGYIKDNNTEMNNGYKLADNDYFGTGSNNLHPTLPAGTYYLVIKDLGANGKQQNATEVIAVNLAEGGSTIAATEIEKAVSRTISYNVALSDAYKDKSYTMQNEAGDLKTVTDNKGTVGETINVKTKVYQKVSNVDVLIDTIDNTTLSTEGKGDKQYPAYSATKEKNNLAVNKDYVVETIKSNLVSGKTSNTTKNNEDGWNINLKGAANVINVKVKNEACFKDEYTTNKIAKDEVVKVNAVMVKSASQTATVQVNKKYRLSDLYTRGISFIADGIDNTAFCGLTPGEYTVTLDIEGYKLSTKSEEQDEQEVVIDLEDAALISEAKYEKVYPTTVKGVIAYKTMADNVATLTADGVAILYNAEKTRIVAASKWKKVNGQITYSLEDGKDGTFGAGDYVLVIRGKGIDTQVKNVNISASNIIVQNQNFDQLAVGGNSNIKSSVQTDKTSGLGENASVVAYDEYYINPLDDAVDDFAARTLLYNSNYDGAYALTFDQTTETEWGVQNISSGKYNVEIVSDTTVPEIKQITVDGTYSTKMIVQLKNFDDLIKIRLHLTNYNNNYEDGQVDYIVASSTDGTVKNEGVFIRSTKSNDEGYFYVPRNKVYTIYVYSNDTLVAEYNVTAQSSENEDIYVPCKMIK